MPTARLNNDANILNDGLDSIVIVNALGHIPGGRTLNVEGFEGNVIKAGHVIVEKADGTFAPLAVSDGSYASLGEGEKYIGVLKVSVLTSCPMASIVTMGQINAAASPYAVTDAIKNGLPRIEFLY